MADLYAIREVETGRIFLAYWDEPLPGEQAAKLPASVLVKYNQLGAEIDSRIAQWRAALTALFP